MLRFIILFCLFFCSIPALAGHFGANDLNPHQATPGLRLDLEEIINPAVSNRKAYRLRTYGFPQNNLYSLYTKSLSGQFTEVLSGLRVNDDGKMISRGSGPARLLDDVLLDPGRYQRGAAWNIAIATIDRSISAFTYVIPYPIIAKSGNCSVSLELISARGDRFLVTGSGFSLGDEVMTEAIFDGRLEQKRRRTSADGVLPRHVITHAAIGTDRKARYSVKDRRCEVDVEYEWGDAALIRTR